MNGALSGELPPGLLFRRPVRADAESVAELMSAVDIAEIGEAETDADDVRDGWDLPRFDLSRDAWLVVSEQDAVQAYGMVWDKVPGSELIGDIYSLPGESQGPIAAALFARIEERAAEHLSAAPREDEVSLGFFAPAESPWGRFLDERGYPVARTYFRMEIELGEETPTPLQIPGIEVRTFQPGGDDAALHLAIQESFAEHYLFSTEPIEEWMKRRSAHPVADPSLWRVAWDGVEPAGGILPYPFERMAWIREVGVRRAWRSRGVGRALLLHAFAALHARGHRRIGLGVDAQNATGATRLYESAGMRITLRHEFHRRVLRAGRAVSTRG
jgi:GNAT superfamily N-acetyltransferase